jgi:hypothetical protein
LDTYAENVNGKFANTHSRICSMVVTFNQPVTLPTNPASAFTLQLLPAGTGTVTLNVTQSTDGKTATLTFSGALTDSRDMYIHPSLANGNYQLVINAANVTNFNVQLDGDGNGVAGGDFMTAATGDAALYRLYGDAYTANGTRYIDGLDFGAFRTAFGTTGAVFDLDGNGSVDGIDYGAFRNVMFTHLDPP